MKAYQILILLLFYLLAVDVFSATTISNTDFESKWGIGWSVAGNKQPALNWMRVGTEGNSKPAFLVSEIAPINLSKKIINFHCRINSIDTFKGVEIRFSSSKDFNDYYYITLETYKDRDFNILQPNEWHNFSYGLGNAKKKGNPEYGGIRYIGMYIQDNGEGPLVFDFSDFKIVPANIKAKLSYTFDDGYDDHVMAAEIMMKYGQRGTVYIIPEAIGKKGYMTLQEIKKLQSEGWGISVHDETPFTDLSALQLKKEIDELITYFKKNNLGKGMRHIAYPMGKQNSSYVVPLVRNTFDSGRLAGGGMETLPPGDFALMRVYNVLDTTTVEELREQVREAKAHNQWLILMFHYFKQNETENNQLEYSLNRFEEVVKMIDEEKIEVLPVNEVVQLLNKKENNSSN